MQVASQDQRQIAQLVTQVAAIGRVADRALEQSAWSKRAGQLEVRLTRMMHARHQGGTQLWRMIAIDPQ